LFFRRLNFYSGRTTANIIFVFPFSSVTKEKINDNDFHYHDFPRKGRNIERLITAVRGEMNLPSLSQLWKRKNKTKTK